MRPFICVLATFVAIASAGADDFSGPQFGQTEVAPAPFPGTGEPMPVPRASYQVVPGPMSQAESGASYSVPMPPGPTIESYHAGSFDDFSGEPTYSPTLPEGTYGPMMIEGAPLPTEMGVALYPHVRVVDPYSIAVDAVPTIIQVPDPCDPNCCVYIEVCFPTCRCPEVSVGPRGRRVWFDFGRREVVITSRANGVISVNYN
jgi:hypothetical protein